MTEKYFNLKRKLEELGYNNALPLEGVPLVECVLADLLQTTRSLQHYMDLSKEALIQRDRLVLEVEPYKCDNASLIQENNKLHQDLIVLREQIQKQSKDNTRKIKAMNEEIFRKDTVISKLQHEVRELGLRGLCAGTQSSRNRIRRRDCGDINMQRYTCSCNDNKTQSIENDLIELTKKLETLEHKNNSYADDIMLLKNQVEHRNAEIVRLNMLLEGGRTLNAVNSDFCTNSDKRIHEMKKQIQELETVNETTKKELQLVLGKQHEAMRNALNLGDLNKHLKEELSKVDKLALKVEEDCNKKICDMVSEINSLQKKLELLTIRNSQLEQLTLQNQVNSPSLNVNKLQEDLNIALKEKDALQEEVRHLLDLNRGLQEKVMSLSSLQKSVENDLKCTSDKFATRDDMQKLLESERQTYEKHMNNVQEKLNETVNLFERHLSKCRNRDQTSHENVFVRDLHVKLCESEQKLLMLKKENEELQYKIKTHSDNSKGNFNDVVNQLNTENSELIKENLSLSRQLCHYKNSATVRTCDHRDLQKDFEKLRQDFMHLKTENTLLCKDKEEYKLRYKESMDLIENLKRDLIVKQKQVEQLLEENCSYKMTNRTGKVSADRLREECNSLREQIKKMQTDVIKEKTMANQIRNIQIETERSSNEMQTELLNLQKQLSLSKNTVDSLERKCNELQSEILSIKTDKNNLIESIKKIDKERDNLVIELDQKTEAVCTLEQKFKSQAYDIEKLENEIIELKRKLNVSKVSEHKLTDNEAQIKFLNGEILRLNQQLDNLVIENKQLQNSLADVNGTLKITSIELDKSRKDVDSLKQQLQHYVAEIRRIEELLSHKEAERSDMLEHFASLSVEANILENTNHSLESESASKSAQLQSYVSKINDLEAKLLSKDGIIDNQNARISNLTYKVSTLGNEIKLLNEEKQLHEKNICYLKQMCNNLQSEKSHIVQDIGETDSELKLYENKIKNLTNNKVALETEKMELKETLQSTEKLLSNARKEIIDLKLALQDATNETNMLQQHINRLNKKTAEFNEPLLTREELELPPLMLEETIHEVSHEEDEESSRYREIHKRLSKYTHSSTL